MSPNVEFVGRLDGSLYNSFVSNCDVFFLSSEDDPFPLSCLEAMKLSKRVVVYKKSGISEVLSDLKGSGVFYDYTPESAIESLKYVLDCKIDEEMYDIFNDRFNLYSFFGRFNRAVEVISRNNEQMSNIPYTDIVQIN